MGLDAEGMGAEGPQPGRLLSEGGLGLARVRGRLGRATCCAALSLSEGNMQNPSGPAPLAPRLRRQGRKRWLPRCLEGQAAERRHRPLQGRFWGFSHVSLPSAHGDPLRLRRPHIASRLSHSRHPPGEGTWEGREPWPPAPGRCHGNCAVSQGPWGGWSIASS